MTISNPGWKHVSSNASSDWTVCFFGNVDRAFPKEGAKTYQIAPMSPFNSPIFFCLHIYSLCKYVPRVCSSWSCYVPMLAAGEAPLAIRVQAKTFQASRKRKLALTQVTQYFVWVFGRSSLLLPPPPRHRARRFRLLAMSRLTRSLVRTTRYYPWNSGQQCILTEVGFLGTYREPQGRAELMQHVIPCVLYRNFYARALLGTEMRAPIIHMLRSSRSRSRVTSHVTSAFCLLLGASMWSGFFTFGVLLSLIIYILTYVLIIG